ncbi:hypothetical protein AMTR_s00314p00017100, partial [Amborella trichopoda]
MKERFKVKKKNKEAGAVKPREEIGKENDKGKKAMGEVRLPVLSSSRIVAKRASQLNLGIQIFGNIEEV